MDFNAETKTYTFETTVSIPVDGYPENVAVSGYFSFDGPIPSGSLHVNDAVFAANLQPEPVKFDAEVSADAGAKLSNNTLTWDVASNEWKTATWDSSVKFAYRTAQADNDDDVLDSDDNTFIENYFKDTSMWLRVPQLA